MKLKAPDNMASFNVDGQEYTKDEDGFIAVDNPNHVEPLARFGCYDPATVDPVIEAADDASAPLDDGERKALVAENVELKLAVDTRDKQIAALRGELTSVTEQLNVEVDAHEATKKALAAAPATVAAEEGGESTGDTSETVHPTPERPPEDASRDGLVDWLKGQNVTVSPAISKDKAWDAVDDFFKSLPETK